MFSLKCQIKFNQSFSLSKILHLSVLLSFDVIAFMRSLLPSLILSLDFYLCLIHLFQLIHHLYKFEFHIIFSSGMILRNHTYLKVYKCWRILPNLKTPTIKCMVIFFKKYLNFQGFYIIYIIIWWFLGWKKFTRSKLGEKGR